MRVLIVSNLDSALPFGQFTRPFHLGRAMAASGVAVGNVGLDCARVDFGPAWSIGRQRLRGFVGALRVAVGRFEPDVVYAHQNMPAFAALLATGSVPVVADFHSLPSVEWASLRATAHGSQARGYRLAALRAEATERVVAARCDGVVAASSALGIEIAARFRPRRPPSVVVNGVDPAIVDAAPARHSPYDTAASPGGRRALAVMPGASSPANRQAIQLLHDVALELRQHAQDVTIHVLGTAEGPQASNVVYHGIQPVGAWIDHADVCLLPYPSHAIHYGGAKNKLLEYLARGRRIVSTAEGIRGLEEVGEWPGVTVADGDAGALATAIALACAPGAPALDPARTAVRERLRWDVLGEGLVSVLRDVAAGNDRSAWAGPPPQERVDARPERGDGVLRG